jgi:hypothetical protein
MLDGRMIVEVAEAAGKEKAVIKARMVPEKLEAIGTGDKMAGGTAKNQQSSKCLERRKVVVVLSLTSMTIFP